jgi:hypothetical protein
MDVSLVLHRSLVLAALLVVLAVPMVALHHRSATPLGATDSASAIVDCLHVVEPANARGVGRRSAAVSRSGPFQPRLATIHHKK